MVEQYRKASDEEYIERNMGSGTRRKAPRITYAGNQQEEEIREENRGVTQEDQKLGTMQDIIDVYDLLKFVKEGGLPPQNERLQIRVMEIPKEA